MISRAALLSVAVVSCASFANGQSVCPGMDADQVLSVKSKRQIERTVEAEISKRLIGKQHLDWDCLAHDFKNTGDNAGYRRIRNDASKATTHRFSVDRTRDWFHLWFPAPGGSNGVYVAIVVQLDDGRIELVERGGKRREIESPQ